MICVFVWNHILLYYVLKWCMQTYYCNFANKICKKNYTTFSQTFLSELYNIRENLRKPCPTCMWQNRPIQESVVFRRSSSFNSRKNREPLSCIITIFIKFILPHDLEGEIYGEFLRHINFGYQRTHSFRTQLSTFFSELRIWSCIEVFVSAVIDLNYISDVTIYIFAILYLSSMPYV